MFRTLISAAAIVSLAAMPSMAAAPVASVTITLTSYRFNPGPIRLTAGVPLRLVLVNRSGKTHDFTATEFFRSSRLLAGQVVDGEVDLDGGQSKMIDLIPARGSYNVHCGKFGHKMLGMSTVIVVS